MTIAVENDDAIREAKTLLERQAAQMNVDGAAVAVGFGADEIRIGWLGVWQRD